MTVTGVIPYIPSSLNSRPRKTDNLANEDAKKKAKEKRIKVTKASQKMDVSIQGSQNQTATMRRFS